MPQGVLDQRLEQELGNRGAEKGRVDLEPRAQAIREPDLLDRQILAYELQLLAERYLRRAIGSHYPAQDLSKVFEHSRGGRRVLVADNHRDGVQAVEEKMRLHLHPQGTEPGLRQLGGQPDRLSFALARFQEVRCRALHAEHREVHRDAEGKAGEEPAQ